MRKIEEGMLAAIKETKTYKKDNTKVIYDKSNNQVVNILSFCLIPTVASRRTERVFKFRLPLVHCDRSLDIGTLQKPHTFVTLLKVS